MLGERTDLAQSHLHELQSGIHRPLFPSTSYAAPLPMFCCHLVFYSHHRTISYVFFFFIPVVHLILKIIFFTVSALRPAISAFDVPSAHKGLHSPDRR